MKENDLSERIEKILDKFSKPAVFGGNLRTIGNYEFSDLTTAILSEIGTCGECKHYYDYEVCTMQYEFKSGQQETNSCSDFERREK